MAMESIDAAAPHARQHGDDDRPLESVIEALEVDYGDSIIFVLEVRDETVVPHVFNAEAIPGADVRAPTDQTTLTTLYGRLDRYFKQRKTMWRLLAEESEDAEYMSTWCEEMKIVRLSLRDGEFFIGLAHECPVIPIIDAIYEARGGHLRGDTPGRVGNPDRRTDLRHR